MRILAVSNLYPPHHAGTFDRRCETVVERLRLRGHEVVVLTSTHGLGREQSDGNVHRRLELNGVYEHPLVTAYGEVKPLELQNNRALVETIEAVQPEVIHVFSLRGLSKSLLFTLGQSRRPVVYDVSDHWLATEVREDPWLRFWNAPSLPFLTQSSRAALEMSGERGRLDDCAPTRLRKGYERLPGLFGDEKQRAAVAPNSLGGFRFDHIYFCSQMLKTTAETVGFCVWNGVVIYPSINAASVGEVKPAGAAIRKLLVAAPLREESGVLTAMKALKIARQAKLDLTLEIFGKGDSTYTAKLRSFAVSNGLPVKFLSESGKLSDFPSVCKGRDVLLHTPEWNEPFPFMALEAMGCGTAVIGSTAGASAELLRHGENCLTFPPGDAEQLAGRLQELILSPALRIQMAQTAQEDVLTRFNDTVVIDQIENYLQTAQTQTE